LIDHDNLEEYADPVDYDRQDSSDTGVAFYAALARETGGPVLEIACGTGRVAIPIARQGFAVTGLDVVPGMLERARGKAAGLPIRWVEGDARDFDLGEERFRLIFLTGNAFQAFLTNADQEALLGRVRAHLHDEGFFAFETRNPRWRTREERDEDRDGLFVDLETRAEEEARPSFTDAEGREVREWRTRTYDHVALPDGVGHGRTCGTGGNDERKEVQGIHGRGTSRDEGARQRAKGTSAPRPARGQG
jgi:SAM-dependent methyltransferase